MSKTKLFNYETLVHATAGATGSLVALSLIYPLDNIKFRIQLEDGSLGEKSTWDALIHVLKTEGLESLYRGLKPALTSHSFASFIYFYAFQGLKSLQLKHLGTPAQSDLIFSIVAGVINVAFSAPLFVVNSRLKIEKQLYYTGLLDGLVHIATSEGLRALWSGIGPSLLLVSSPAINFTVYEALKRRVSSKTAFTYFLLGAISKAISTVATYPLQVAQTRQRYSRDNSMSTAALLLNIVKQKGPSGLYQGLEAKLLQTVLSSALMFMTYEKITEFVLLLLIKRKVKLV